MARVEVSQVSKVFSTGAQHEIPALRDVSLTIASGELFAIVGPSGSGKSTLLRLIAGLEEPTSGSIAIDGRPMAGVPAQDRDVAMVFQTAALYPHLTIYENLALGLKLRRVPAAEIQPRVSETAAMLELSDCLKRFPNDLSGGQRQRVALGRAVVRRPKVLLLDEPLSHLDAPMRAHMRLEFVRLHARLGTTVIHVTHDQLEAMALGRRVAVLNEGRIQQVAGAKTLYHEPANQFVAGFVGSPPMNFFSGQLIREAGVVQFRETTQEQTSVQPAAPSLCIPIPETVFARRGKLNGFVGREILLGIRPEELEGRPHGALGETARVAGNDPDVSVGAVVEVVESLGAETHVVARTRSHQFVARLPGWREFTQGELLFLSFRLERAHWFDPITGAALS